ncbi:MAG: MlaD family protein [Kiloniellales bacterium]
MSFLDGDDDDLPEAKGGRGRRFSLVWLVPIVALAVAGYLGWRTVSDQGPRITVTFDTGDGLEAGQTQVKHKDVALGSVESVTLTDDLQDVVVGISMNAEAEDFLGPETQFWVERPRIGPSGVSGLGTLVSGAYVAFNPKPGKLTTTFKGLDQPPVLQSSDPGTEYLLTTSKLSSISAGSPIFYRGIQVGEILGYELNKDEEDILIHAFVREPHDAMVRTGTRFWNASGIALTTEGGDFRLQIESLQAVFAGGVAFATGSVGKTSPLAEKGQRFRLFPNEQAADEAGFSRRRRFLLFFPDNVSGLERGAPVMLRGMKIGEVVSIRLEFDVKSNQVLIPVVIEIEADRFKVVGGDIKDISAVPYEIADALVKRGLRAQLQFQNFITGSMMVALEFYPDEARQGLGEGGKYPIIPTKPTALTEVKRTVTEILNKIAALPFEGLMEDVRRAVRAYGALAQSPEVLNSLKELDSTLASAQQLMATANRDIGPALRALRVFLSDGSQTLDKLSSVLTTVEPDSPLQRDLRQAMVELRDALRSVRVLADFLEAQPDALLRGRIDLKGDFAR